MIFSSYVYKYTTKYQSNTTKLYYVYYCIMAILPCLKSLKVLAETDLKGSTSLSDIFFFIACGTRFVVFD